MRNLNSFLSNLDKYVHLGRNENAHLGSIAAGISPTDMQWLNAAVGGARGASHEESLLRQQLLHHFLYWLVTDFVLPLLSVCFYATEVEGRGSEVFYYRKPNWAIIVRRGVAQIKDHFMPVSVPYMPSLRGGCGDGDDCRCC